MAMSLPLIIVGLCGLNIILTAAAMILWRMWRTERGLRRYNQSVARLNYSTAVLAARHLADEVANAMVTTNR